MPELESLILAEVSDMDKAALFAAMHKTLHFIIIVSLAFYLIRQLNYRKRLALSKVLAQRAGARRQAHRD